MRIIDTKPFTSPVCVCPGDTLCVTWHDSGLRVASIQTEIFEAQTLDTAVLVEYTPEEAREMGLESALGVFAGQSKEMV